MPTVCKIGLLVWIPLSGLHSWVDSVNWLFVEWEGERGNVHVFELDVV